MHWRKKSATKCILFSVPMQYLVSIIKHNNSNQSRPICPGLDVTDLKPQEINQSQSNMRKIIDYDWSISYGLKFTTPIIDNNN